MAKFYIGIDPGFSGGIAVYRPYCAPPDDVRGLPLTTVPISDTDRLIDLSNLDKWLDEGFPELAYCNTRLALEHAQTPFIPKSKASIGKGSFAYGCVFGQLIGWIMGRGWWEKTTLARPRVWQKVLLTEGIKGREAIKAACVALAKQRFPYVFPESGRRKKPHSGVVDAICLAIYAHQLPESD